MYRVQSYKIKTKALSIFLSILMLSGYFFGVTPGLSAYAAQSDSGKSWYDSANSSFSIQNAAQLKDFARLVNEGNRFSGKKVYLVGDIDLKNSDNWIPIGSDQSHAFSGTFDGQGYSIKNLSIQDSSPETAFHGLFGVADSASVLQNIRIDGVNIQLKDGTKSGLVVINGSEGKLVASGGIAGFSSGLVQSCLVKGAISIDNGVIYDNTDDSFQSTGAIVGFGTKILHCSAVRNEKDSAAPTFEIRVKDDTNGFAGGIAGMAYVVGDCYSTCNIKGGNKTIPGGLVGAIGNSTGDSYVYNSFSTGLVIGNSLINGGLLGSAAQASVTNCYASGNVSSIGNASMGGFVGQAGCTLTNCYAYGNVNGFDDALGSECGGFAGDFGGFAERPVTTITSCYAFGDVKALNSKCYVGSFAGRSKLKNYINCNASGTIKLVGGTGSKTIVQVTVGQDHTSSKTSSQITTTKNPVLFFQSGASATSSASNLLDALNGGKGAVSSSLTMKNTWLNDTEHINNGKPVFNPDIPIFTINPEKTDKADNNVGETVTFQSRAFAMDDGLVTYNWEKSTNNGKSWAVINGATSKIYTTDPLKISDNNTQFRCRAKNVYDGNAADGVSNAVTVTIKGSPVSPVSPISPTSPSSHDSHTSHSSTTSSESITVPVSPVSPVIAASPVPTVSPTSSTLPKSPTKTTPPKFPKPQKSSTISATPTTSTNSSPKTGDNDNYVLLIVLMTASFCGCIFLKLSAKKSSNQIITNAALYHDDLNPHIK